MDYGSRRQQIRTVGSTKTMKKLLLFSLLLSCSFSLLAQKKSKKDYLITLETNKGTMHMVLFEDTPLHRANFLKLVEEAAYDSVIFHRVINEFMIQGGNLNLKTYKTERRKEPLKRIPYEFTPKHLHYKGALAAARGNNPERESSGSQFYIVTGKKYNEVQIKRMEKSTAAKQEGRELLPYTEAQINAYKAIGGTPFLDNNYTVFGEVIDGIEVADAIQVVKTRRDKPLEDIWMVISAKKMRKKKITKMFGYRYM